MRIFMSYSRNVAASAAGLFAVSLSALPQLAWSADADAQALEEVIVTATFRQQSLLEMPGSATVLTASTLHEAGQQHIEDVLGLIPNLNWAGGSSRPRYFQIRGIGEREQYEGAPNPSVGFLIDDIDFSGLGMAATLFDVEQIEVLRGPQGTRYGANALAGLISVRGKAPEQETHASAELGVGNYGEREIGASATGPVESLSSAWRLSLRQYHSDGFMANSYLHRDDTNDRNEFSGRFKWQWQIDNDSTLDATLLQANLHNGYDAWAIDNTRTTLSDKPGQDSQRSSGVSLKYNGKLADELRLTVTGAFGDTHSIHAYDGDWGNTQSWQELMHNWAIDNGVSGNAWQDFVYDYVYRADRYRDTRSVDVRLASEHQDSLNWLVGAYVLNLREHISELSQGTYADPVAYDYFSDTDDYLDSRYRATSTALYGQLDGQLLKRWRWSAGLRGEQRNARDQDQRASLDAPPPSVAESRNESMWGGQVSLSYQMAAKASSYLSVSRGYKAGGFNLGYASDAAPAFAAETLMGYELGYKRQAQSGRWYVDADVFYQQRTNMQVLDSKQLVAGDPNSFVFYTTNVGAGYNAGLEASLQVVLTNAVDVGGSLGLLRTRSDAYVLGDGTVVPAREQAHAPEYTANVYAAWHAASGWFTRADVSAKDDFYYSNAPSTQRSFAYTLTNIKAGYQRDQWSVSASVRNVFNQDTIVRAFEFGNEPPDFSDALYLQHGEPRQAGVSASWSF
jgi:iron complex outermembrane recepter protein